MKLIKIDKAQHTELKTRAIRAGDTLEAYVRKVLQLSLSTHLVSCSQCGSDFRVESSQATGYSHCHNHRGQRNER